MAAVGDSRIVSLRSGRNVYRRALLTGLLVVVLGGSLLLGWTWRHPQAFADPGGWGFEMPKKHVGDTIYVGMSYPRNRDGGHVTLHGGQVNIDAGAENAEVDLMVCALDPDAQIGAIGSYAGDTIRDDCSTLVPIDGQRLDLHYSPLRQQVVLAVTLTHRGAVEISDVTLDYSHRWQRGSQRTGGRVIVSTAAIHTGAG